MKLNKDDLRKKFRPTLNIQDIQTFYNKDPNKEYKWVHATSQREGLNRIDRYLNKGWDVEYSKDKALDDRKTASNQDGKEEDLRMSPVTTTSRSGETYILMSCLKTQRDKNEQAKRQARMERFKAMQKLIKKNGRSTTIVSSEIRGDD